MDSAYLKEKRILLVDDEKGLQDMVVSILKKDGYTNIKTAGNRKKGGGGGKKIF